MAEGKKIVFEGVDKTSQASDSAKKGVVGLHEANIKGLKESNTLLKEQNALLEQQKRLITSIASEGLSKPQQQVVSQLTNKLFQTSERVNPEHLRSYAKILEGQMHIGSSGSMSEKLIQKVQELIETQKLQHRETTTEHKKDDLEAKKIMTGPLTFLGKEAARHKSKERIEKLNERSEKKYGKDITSTDSSSHEKQVSIPLSFEGMLESMTHKLATVIGAGAFGGLLGKAVEMTWGVIEKKHEMHASATTGIETSFRESELVGVNAYVKDIAGKRRSRSELTSFQQGQFGAIGTSGMGYNMSTLGEALGISAAETAGMVGGSSRSRGRRVSNSEMFGSQFSNKVLGIDQGNISSLEGQSRYGGDSNVKNVIEEVITSLGLEKDRSKANELTQLLVTLGQQQLSVLGKIDQKGNLAQIKAFQSLGGSLMQNAETLGPMMSNFNQALANPKGDFQKAERFATLSKLNPGKSFPQLMREMQKGKDSQGVIRETLSKISKRGGGIDGMVMELVSSGLASNYEEAFQIAEGYTKNNTVFDDLSGAGITGKSTSGQIGNVVDRFDKVSKAKIQNAFLKSPEAGYAMVTQEMGLYDSSSKPEELGKQGDNRSKLAVATGAAANKMVEVAKQAEIGAKLYKESAADMKKASENLKSFLKDSRTGIRLK